MLAIEMEYMRSPICNLERSISGAAFNVAPEKEARCAKIRDEYGITVTLYDDNGFSVKVDTEKRTIWLPISSLEYLWAFSHYCWVLIQEYSSSQREGTIMFDCMGNTRLQTSFSLLEWAKNNLLTTGIELWPEKLPQPGKNSDLYGDVNVANELFLCSLGWMMHHEIAHIVLNHPPLVTNFSELEEKEADKYATEWLLSGLVVNSPVLKKRAIGVAVGISCLQSLEVNTNSCLRNTHPSAHNRIFDCLSKYKVGNEEAIEAFLVVILQFLFHNEGIQVDIEEKRFSTLLSDILVDISRMKNLR